MSSKKLLLIGAGGHAKSCIDVIENSRTYTIGGLIGLPDELGITINGYEVIGIDSELYKLSKKYTYALISIGQVKNHKPRYELFNKALTAGFKLVTILAPSAYVSKRSSLGEGTLVSHGAVINSMVNIGVNCIINSNSLVEHDAQIGNHCHISTGAIINGQVSIGHGSFIGSGAVVREGVSIGKNVFVGAGKIVTKNLRDFSILKN